MSLHVPVRESRASTRSARPVPPEWVISQQQYRAWLAEREREAELVAHSQRMLEQLLRGVVTEREARHEFGEWPA